MIPRTKGDSGGGDKVHEWLEGEEGNVGKHQKEVETREWPKDEERKPRSKGEMEKEARWLREEMEKDEGDGANL